MALLISLAYVVQVQAGAWYVKLTDRLFGAPDQAKPLLMLHGPSEAEAET